jgi:hypothetical protein
MNKASKKYYSIIVNSWEKLKIEIRVIFHNSFTKQTE